MTTATLSTTPEQAEDRLLWERCRIGYVVVAAGIAAVMVGETVLRSAQRPAILMVQGTNIAVLAGCLALSRQPLRRASSCLICLSGFAATAVAIGAAGILARDAMSALVVLVGLAMGAAVLVPWGAPTQAVGIAITVAVALWTLITLHPQPRELWLQPIGSVLPTFGASVIVAYLLRRQRLAVAAAEGERRAREHGLWEANRRLEVEIREHEKTEGALRLALMELDHRVKNTLATLQSMVEQGADGAVSAGDLAEALSGRITAMARIHTALAAQRWEGLHLRELIEIAVSPYCPCEERVSLRCDDASLSAVEARALGMTLHELATNAAKYGALSTALGRVEVTAAVSSEAEPCLHLVWKEEGGPRVKAPERCGLGTRLIEKALAYESGGTSRLSFDEDGLRCEIDMPLAPLVEERA